MSRPADRITVSRSRRGTTVKASGSAAQALFDALTKPAAAPMAAKPADVEVAYTIHFEDHGQDFLEWDVDTAGKVVACRPFQAFVWVGREVVKRPEPGEKVMQRNGTGDVRAIRYPVTKVVTRLTATDPATPAPAAPG